MPILMCDYCEFFVDYNVNMAYAKVMHHMVHHHLDELRDSFDEDYVGFLMDEYGSLSEEE